MCKNVVFVNKYIYQKGWETVSGHLFTSLYNFFFVWNSYCAFQSFKLNRIQTNIHHIKLFCIERLVKMGFELISYSSEFKRNVTKQKQLIEYSMYLWDFRWSILLPDFVSFWIEAVYNSSYLMKCKVTLLTILCVMRYWVLEKYIFYNEVRAFRSLIAHPVCI